MNKEAPTKVKRRAMGRLIPENFELVAGAAAISVLVHHLYMALGVSKARKKCVLMMYL